MINNSIIKRKFTIRLVILIIGIICAALVVPVQKKVDSINKAGKDAAISFAEAYASDMVSPEYIKDNSYVAYVDIQNKPAAFAYYDDSEQFAYVYDDSGMYIIKASKSKLDSLSSEVASNGTARVLGAVKELDEEVMDMAFETYSEFDIEDPMNREEFDDYFKGAAIYEGYNSNASSNYVLFEFLIVVVGILCLLGGIPSVFSYVVNSKKLTDSDKEMLAAELEDPRTVFMKKCGVFFTPRHLVYADNRLEVLPYEEIIWCYKYTFRYCFIPVFNCVNVHTSKKKKKRIAFMSLFASYPDTIVKELFTQINYHNPSTIFGYTKEAQTYYHCDYWKNTQQSA